MLTDVVESTQVRTEILSLRSLKYLKSSWIIVFPQPHLVETQWWSVMMRSEIIHGFRWDTSNQWTGGWGLHLHHRRTHLPLLEHHLHLSHHSSLSSSTEHKLWVGDVDVKKFHHSSKVGAAFSTGSYLVHPVAQVQESLQL